MLPILLPLDDPAVSIELAGGKGANLSHLIRAGFPTPGGFIVTTVAYRAFIEANDLAPLIAAPLPPAEADLPTLEAASAALRAQIEALPLPNAIASGLLTAYHALSDEGAGPVAVAVRSSATAEDLPTASFAGQQDTLLNVRGEAALLDAVRRCWGSLWSARAIAYRARQGIPSDAVSMAVVVQRMVPAEAAGVLFTLNPVTGSRDEVLIEAAWGLGEAVVAGQVTPDTMVVEKATGQVRQVTVSDKRLMTALSEAGTTTLRVSESERQRQVLSAAQAARLATLGQEIEATFAEPQDIEWAIAGGQPFILQARPITTVSVSHSPTRPAPPGDDDWLPQVDQPPVRSFDLWTRANFGEVLPYPVSPFALSGFQRWGASMGGGEEQDYAIARRLYGRIYANEGGLRHTIANHYGLPTTLFDATWGSRRPDLGPQGKLRPLRLAHALFAMLRGVRRPKAPPAVTLPPTADALFAQIDKWVAAFALRDLSQGSEQSLWAESLTVWEARTQAMMTRHLQVSQRAVVGYALLEKVVGWWGRDEGSAPRLVTSLTGVHAAEMGPMLWRIAQTVRGVGLAPLVLERPAVEALAHLRTHPDAQPVLAQLDQFLERHGYRCPGEPELSLPRWREQPEQVLELVAGYLRAGEALDPAAQEARQRSEQEATVAAILSRLDPFRARLFRTLLANAQEGVRQRDNSRSYLAKLLYLQRACQVELGRRWTERGWLHAPDDIFFLLHHELDAILAANDPDALGRALKSLVTGRRQAHEFWFTVEAPEVIGPDGVPLPDPSPPDSTCLRGIAASGGRATGTARLIDDPRHASRLKAGDILVTRATDPGWTPLFPLAAGLVLEIGGQLSHGAIVAREYGIPAVTNVYGAMARLRDGQRITVDGTRGELFLEPEQLTPVPGDDDWPALGEHPPQPFDLWTQVNLGEAWPFPITPLTWSLLPHLVGGGLRYTLARLDASYIQETQWAKRFFGRVYLNEGAITHIFTQEYGLPSTALAAAFGNRRHTGYQKERGFNPARFFGRLPAFLRQMGDQSRADQQLAALFPRIDQWVTEFSEEDWAEQSDQALWEHLSQVWMPRYEHTLTLHSTAGNKAFWSLAWLDGVVGWANQRAQKHLLVGGITGVHAAEMAPMLWEIAQAAHQAGVSELFLTQDAAATLATLRDLPHAQPVLASLERFLRRHGHRCAMESEWRNPRWAEAPEQVIEMVVGFLRAGEEANPLRATERQQRQRIEATVTTARRLDPLRRALFRRVLDMAHESTRFRDNSRFFLLKVGAILRRIYMVLAQRWVSRGWLTDLDDIFFLTVADIKALLKAEEPDAVGSKWPALVAARRLAYEHWFTVEAPEVIAADGQPLTATQPAMLLNSTLQGVAASGGCVTGTARIIVEPRAAATLKPGEILVTRSTDSGWTPIFPLVSALVLDVGGILSHGSIVAREYGIPAVVNVQGATHLIRDGQTITVDGTNGRVLLA